MRLLAVIAALVAMDVKYKCKAEGCSVVTERGPGAPRPWTANTSLATCFCSKACSEKPRPATPTAVDKEERNPAAATRLADKNAAGRIAHAANRAMETFGQDALSSVILVTRRSGQVLIRTSNVSDATLGLLKSDFRFGANLSGDGGLSINELSVLLEAAKLHSPDEDAAAKLTVGEAAARVYGASAAPAASPYSPSAPSPPGLATPSPLGAPAMTAADLVRPQARASGANSCYADVMALVCNSTSETREFIFAAGAFTATTTGAKVSAALHALCSARGQVSGVRFNSLAKALLSELGMGSRDELMHQQDPIDIFNRCIAAVCKEANAAANAGVAFEGGVLLAADQRPISAATRVLNSVRALQLNISLQTERPQCTCGAAPSTVHEFPESDVVILINSETPVGGIVVGPFSPTLADELVTGVPLTRALNNSLVSVQGDGVFQCRARACDCADTPVCDHACKQQLPRVTKSTLSALSPTLIIENRSSKSIYPEDLISIDGHSYELRLVIIRRGTSVDVGHYFSRTRKPGGGGWAESNDGHVREVPDSARCCTEAATAATIFVYERLEAESTPPPLAEEDSTTPGSATQPGEGVVTTTRTPVDIAADVQCASLWANFAQTQRPEDSVRDTARGVSITYGEVLKTMLPTAWLSDSHINSFSYRLNVNVAMSRVYTLSSLLWAQLFSGLKGYDYSLVSHWGAALQKHVDIFGLDFLILPLHVAVYKPTATEDRNHWAMLVFEIKRRSIMYIDSLTFVYDNKVNRWRQRVSVADAKAVCATGLRWYGDEHMRHFGTALPEMDKWTLEPTPNTASRQTDGSACGVYVSMINEFIHKHRAIPTSADITLDMVEKSSEARAHILVTICGRTLPKVPSTVTTAAAGGATAVVAAARRGRAVRPAGATDTGSAGAPLGARKRKREGGAGAATSAQT